MQYPDKLIPRTYFKQIESNLSSYFLCRVVNSENLLAKENGLYPDETLCSKDKDLFDYSTNLLGHFLPEDNQIILIGDNNKYFYDYWDFVEEVIVPVFQQDFAIDSNRRFFLLPIAEIHRKVCLPMPNPPKKPDETLTAYVVHTPTRSNFWHFSVKWMDKNGKFEKYKGSDWQKRICSTMRHTLQELINPQLPDEVTLLPEGHYVKGSP